MATEGPHLLKANMGIIMFLVGLKNVNGPNSKRIGIGFIKEVFCQENPVETKI